MNECYQYYMRSENNKIPEEIVPKRYGGTESSGFKSESSSSGTLSQMPPELNQQLSREMERRFSTINTFDGLESAVKKFQGWS